MEAKTENRTKWPQLGAIYATNGVNDWFNENETRRGVFGAQCLKRYFARDWGDLDDIDRASNDAALVNGARILAAYHLDGRKIWIITEAENDDGRRAYTTILFPEEY